MPGQAVALLEEKKITKLSIREANFCRYYIELSGNGTRAYMKAFKVTNYGTAATESWRLLKKPEIQARLEGAKRAIEEKIGVTYGRLVEKGAEHLEATKEISALIIPGKGCKKADSKTTDFIEVPDVDAQLKAADYLAKLCGFYPQKESGKPIEIELNIAQVYLPAKEGGRNVAMEVVPAK